jgi:F0F1-type ATP synthase membrane subunit b/b'
MGEEQLDQVMRLAEEAAERADTEAEAIMERAEERAEQMMESAEEQMERAHEMASAKANGLRERAMQEAERAREQAERAREEAREQAEAARERAREIRDQAREARHKAREALRAVRDRGRHDRAGTGTVTVHEGEVVESAVAYGGPLVVEGHVEQDAVAFGGDVTLGPKAWVEGDVVAFGGSIHRADTAVVEGDANAFGGSVIGAAIAKGIAEAADRSADPPRPHIRHGVSGIVAGLIWFICLFGIGFIASLLIPARMKLIEGEIKSNPLKAGLAGVVAALALVPLSVLLVITLIGIPVAAALWLMFPLAAAVGFTAVASEVGMRLPVFRGRKTQALVLALGLALLLVAAQIPVLGPISIVLLALIGFGAIVRTRFGSRPAGPKPTGPAATSDIPSGVPV